MSCWSCGADVPVGALFCPACGVEVRTQGVASPDPAATEQDVHALLAEANLMRLRKDMTGASQRCIDVLQRVPKSASAHSLLGDICHDEGRLRDAIEWYRLALTLDPSRLTDRTKLDQLIDQVYTSPSAETDLSSIQPEDLSPRAPHLLNGAKEAWFLPRQWRHRSGLTAGLVGVGVLCLVTVALYIILSRVGNSTSPKQTPLTTAQTKAGLIGTESQTPPSMNAPSQTNTVNPEDAIPAPPDHQKQPPAPTKEDVTIGQSAPEADPDTLAKREKQLKQVADQIAPQLDPPATILETGIDPRKEVAEIVFAVQEGSTVTATRDAILNAAARLGYAIAANDSHVSGFTAKAYVITGDENQTQQVLSFSGDTSRRDLLTLEQGPLSRDKAEKIFSNALWGEKLKK